MWGEFYDWEIGAIFLKSERIIIFIIDKTAFIKEWREGGDDVTLIGR